MSTALLDPQPFRDWYAEQKAKGFQDEEIARRFGVDSRTLRRWRKESEHIRRGELEDALMNSDLSLWDIYPDLEDEDGGEGYCGSCAENVAVDVRGRCLWCLSPTGSVRRSSRPAGTYGKLRDPQFLALHRLHTDGGLTIRELGRRIWKRAGYASEKSAEVTIWRAFKRLGLPTVDRRVLYALPDSRRCVDDNQAGGRCKKAAMLGADRCMQHDEQRREEVLIQAARAAQVRRKAAA